MNVVTLVDREAQDALRVSGADFLMSGYRPAKSPSQKVAESEILTIARLRQALKALAPLEKALSDHVIERLEGGASYSGRVPIEIVETERVSPRYKEALLAIGGEAALDRAKREFSTVSVTKRLKIGA